MTLVAFILIFYSAFSHAGWNFLCKSHRPSPSFMLVLNTSSALCLLPFFAMLKIQWCDLPHSFWYAFACSVVANAVYGFGLALAYRYGDISISYPLSRALPVLLTALITALFHLGKTPSAIAYCGLFILFLGCVFLPQRTIQDLSLKNFLTPALIPICVAAMGTTCYTISDSVSTKIFAAHSPSSVLVVCGSYYFILKIGMCITQLASLLLWDGKKNWKEIVQNYTSPFPYLAGIFNCIAYLLVLIAYNNVTNVSYVQAFRQMGLPLGVFAGVYFLHEKLSYMKIIGITLIVLGLVLTIL